VMRCRHLTTMTDLTPDALRIAWQTGAMNGEAYEQLKRDLLAADARIWTQALQLPGTRNLTDSLLRELAAYARSDDLVAIEERCRRSVSTVADEWRRRGVAATDANAVQRYYAESADYLYELTWWHTLVDDHTPLAYVTALRFAQQHGCRRYCDFGSGAGAGGVLFARHGFDVWLTDVGIDLLAYTRWRLAQRGLAATIIDAKSDALPTAAVDFVTALDVLEHLVDPAAAIERLDDVLVPGGFLFGRFHGEEDCERPQHIVTDFGPTLERLRDLGYTETWRDDWLWGHQVFRKPG
jgi:SAM-dependent methyltransferase